MINGRVVSDATTREAPLVGPRRDGRHTGTTLHGCAESAAGELVIRDTGDGVVSVLGELDCATAPRLHRHLDQDRSARILDMYGVSFIDARGLDPVIAAVGARGPDDTIVLRDPSPCVMRLLELTALIHHVSIDHVVAPGPDEP